MMVAIIKTHFIVVYYCDFILSNKKYSGWR